MFRCARVNNVWGDLSSLKTETKRRLDNKWNSDPYRTEARSACDPYQAWWPSPALPRESEGWLWCCQAAIMGTQGSRCFAKQAHQTYSLYDKQIWSSFYWPSMFLDQIYYHYTKSANIREELLNPFFKQTKHSLLNILAINLKLSAGHIQNWCKDSGGSPPNIPLCFRLAPDWLLQFEPTPLSAEILRRGLVLDNLGVLIGWPGKECPEQRSHWLHPNQIKSWPTSPKMGYSDTMYHPPAKLCSAEWTPRTALYGTTKFDIPAGFHLSKLEWAHITFIKNSKVSSYDLSWSIFFNLTPEVLLDSLQCLKISEYQEYWSLLTLAVLVL